MIAAAVAVVGSGALVAHQVTRLRRTLKQRRTAHAVDRARAERRDLQREYVDRELERRKFQHLPRGERRRRWRESWILARRGL